MQRARRRILPIPCCTNSTSTCAFEIPSQRIVFATDYPQEIRDTAKVRDFVDGIRALGGAGQDILSGNVGLLLRLACAA